MKKALRFIRSMRFGILLLVLIALCSVVGSLIPQDKAVSWYAQNYGSLHGVILMLRLHRIFQSWYFIALLVLLCLNLTLCSLVRIVSVVRDRRRVVARTAALPDQVRLSAEGVQRLRRHLEDIRCRRETIGEAEVYRKNAVGRYGSFLIHLSILLVVLFGAAALYLPQVVDRTCLPGESVVMDDGTEISVDAFHIEDVTGRLDYSSRIRIRLPDGRNSEWVDIRVNHPLAFGSWKVYQQTYGTAGSVTVTNLADGGSDDFTLTDTALLSLDGASGLWYEAVYPDYLLDPSGNMTLVTSTTGRYEHPVYQVLLASDGNLRPILVFPGEELEAGGLRFRFNEPIEYPGLRIKRTPTVINALLIASFVLMLVGLYIAFFMPPVLIKTDAEGYAVGGLKPEGMRIKLDELLQEYRREE
ncbi:MAG: cytochrome c biogenesis protein ResB [Oscillospiraceae bacterium]|nr:cytochrome c biogenesis protein ResB [Oscillospiraceae bacterium]